MLKLFTERFPVEQDDRLDSFFSLLSELGEVARKTILAYFKENDTVITYPEVPLLSNQPLAKKQKSAYYNNIWVSAFFI
ncbi:hypothetical protein GF325_03725 [Candidatus Bathyarchaeota archaeon]|nr:hypothetical protein [Candidatus Bathyarchaeota archaeon]